MIPIAHSIKVNVAAIVAVHSADRSAHVRDRALEVLLRLLPAFANGDGGVELIRVVRVFDDTMHLAINGARDDAVKVVARNVTADHLTIVELEHFAAHIIHLE